VGEYDLAVDSVAMCVAGVNHDGVGDFFHIIPRERITAAWTELLVEHMEMLRLAPALREQALVP